MSLSAVGLPAVERPAAAAPLVGVRVLDFTHIVAGPFCTRVLADLGAEVLHVETQTRTEGVGVHVGRRDVRVDRNKESITLNLKHEGGQAAAARLAAAADVIVENFSSGVMNRLKLDYETLAPSNPGLIYVSMSGFGHTGPRRDWTSMNMNLQGYSGLMLVTGAEGDPPTSVSNSWNDFIGGLHAAFAVLQVLVERRRDGKGRYLDLAQAECSVATLGPLVLAANVNRQDPPRIGNRSTSIAPQGCYPCAGEDEWCAISVQSDEQWAALATAMGDSALATDSRFTTVLGRFRHHDEIDERIGAGTRGLSKEEVQAKLTAVGVPAERVRRADDVVESDDSGHVFTPLVPPGASKPDLAAALPFFLGTSETMRPQPPAPIGAHTRQALREWIGMSDAEIDELESAGALV
jgi:benzylsuccinate CoA-transferase BbsF subunit